jgi:hypothetical protein
VLPPDNARQFLEKQPDYYSANTRVLELFSGLCRATGVPGRVTMKLEKVVPFGRSLDEYIKIFSLSDSDLKKKIIGVGDGPASFNVEMHTLGNTVVSVDPAYVFRGEEIKRRFDSVIDDIISQVKATPDDWVWTYHVSPDHLREHRVRVFRDFMADYDRGKAEGRYIAGGLPALDFADDEFDLALCSHLLFLYSDRLSYEFHLASVLEMMRVALEVRIFPLMTLMLKRSSYLQPLTEDLALRNFCVSIEKVAYELQKGGNEMLRITKAE